jgi:replication factor C subunit 2/4
MANFFDIKARKAEAAANGAANKKPERSAADDDQPWVEK